MKKLIIAFFISLLPVFAYSYDGDWEWNNAAVGIGYSRFNEAHGSDTYKFKNNQLNIFTMFYGVYIDANIGIHEYSPYDNCEMASWGMDFGYLFPINKPNYSNVRIFFGPIAGFDRVGTIDDAPWNDYIDYWGRYHYGESFSPLDTYFNAGCVLAASVNHFWIQGSITRMHCGISVGVKF